MHVGQEQIRHLSLQDLTHIVEASPAGRRIVHFHVSHLAENAVDRARMRTAIDFLRNSINKLGEGDVTVAPNRDIVCAIARVRLANIISICRKIENYFCGDNDFTEKNWYGETYFYTVIDPSIEMGKFKAFAVSMIDFNSQASQVSAEKPKELISVANFSQIVEIVQHADLTHHVFNQPIYNTVHPKTSIEFVEFFISVKSFEDALCPQYSILGDAWLFNRLTEEFDRVVLRHITRELPNYRHKAFSLNINLKSVFCKEFAVFAESLSAQYANRIILEINKLSAFANWPLFEEVCTLARQKSFRICLDGLDLRDFAALQLRNINFDLVKLRWAQGILTDRETLAMAARTISTLDRSRIILSMCDSPDAFTFARTLGIQLVQGRLADKYFRNAVSI